MLQERNRVVVIMLFVSRRAAFEMAKLLENFCFAVLVPGPSWPVQRHERHPFVKYVARLEVLGVALLEQLRVECELHGWFGTGRAEGYADPVLFRFHSCCLDDRSAEEHAFAPVQDCTAAGDRPS